MSFQNISGQEQVKRFLQGNLRNGSLFHGYLFCGPRGSGRLAMARALAQAVYCEQHADDACGECVSCRKFMHGNIVVYQQVGLLKDKTTITREQIFDLQHKLSYRAEDHYKKIYVINDAHTMKAPQANLLLKYLEEPGADQMAILIADSEQSVLATIRSRLQIVKFAPPNPDQLLTQLEQPEYRRALDAFDSELASPVDAELKKLAVHLAGNIEDALYLLQCEWFAEYRNLVIELLKSALKHPYQAVVVLQQRLGKLKADSKKQLDMLARMLELLFRDLICHAGNQAQKVVFIGQQTWLRTVAISRNINFWVECAERTFAFRTKRIVNANWQMMLEQYFIEMKSQ